MGRYRFPDHRDPAVSSGLRPETDLYGFLWSAVTVGLAVVSLLAAFFVSMGPGIDVPGRSPDELSFHSRRYVSGKDTCSKASRLRSSGRSSASAAVTLAPRYPCRKVAGACAPPVADSARNRGLPGQEPLNGDGGSSACTVRPVKVAVLSFHDLSRSFKPGSLLTTVSRFEQILSLLRSSGYQTFFVSDIPALLSGRYCGLRRGCKPVVITFDDGYRNNYELLFPLLRRYAMKATIFLIVGKLDCGLESVRTGRSVRRSEVAGGRFAVGAGSSLSWAQVREMASSGLVEFGTHTYAMHRNLLAYVYGRVSHAERVARWRKVYSDLLLARRRLSSGLGRPVVAMAWPHGKSDSRLRKVAAMAGYRLVFNTRFGINVPGFARLNDLDRISASSPWLEARSLLKRIWLAERGRGLDGKVRPLAWVRR